METDVQSGGNAESRLPSALPFSFIILWLNGEVIEAFRWKLQTCRSKSFRAAGLKLSCKINFAHREEETE